MLELFPITSRLPAGFSYSDDFLTVEEEADLIRSIRQIELKPMVFQGFEARRKIASFGYDYSFEHRRLKKGGPIPAGFIPLILKVAHVLSMPAEDFAELLITEYPVASVINWHRDAPPFGLIAGIPLLSDCTLKLRPHDKTLQNRKATVAIPVRRRSLYVMSDVAREEWQHSTAPVDDVRYSITLRTLKMTRINAHY